MCILHYLHLHFLNILLTSCKLLGKQSTLRSNNFALVVVMEIEGRSQHAVDDCIPF